jgi:hypothetical protein
VACGADQCREHPEAGHIWRPLEDGKKGCACGAQIYDRLFALVHARRSTKKEPVDWRRLRLPGEVWAVDLGRMGRLFNVHTGGGHWRPWWVNRKGNLHPLTKEPVPAEYARLLTDDLAKQSNEVANGRYGARRGKGAQNMALVVTEEVGRKLRIWEAT